ncbi:MAG: hypothetical protein RLZZ269_2079, partial [Actinomycetota bacterium]
TGNLHGTTANIDDPSSRHRDGTYRNLLYCSINYTTNCRRRGRVFADEQ